jgi:hypothetical protein
MKSNIFAFCAIFLACSSNRLFADTITSAQLQAPFGVQPDAGLIVTEGVTQGFFSDLSGLPFPGPGIVDVLSDVTAFDGNGDPLVNFQVTDAIITQGLSMETVPVESFLVSSPTTYSSFLNPLNEVTVDPDNLNLAFLFDSDSSLQYTYQLMVTGVPDNGFLLYDDVEGAQVTPTPEIAPPLMVLIGLALMVGSRRFREYSRARVVRSAPVREVGIRIVSA